jgi:hypothetical protein
MNAWCWPSSILLLLQLTACTRDPHGTARDRGLCLSAEWRPVAIDDTIILRPGHLVVNSSDCLHERPRDFTWQVEGSTVLAPLDLGRFSRGSSRILGGPDYPRCRDYGTRLSCPSTHGFNQTRAA